MPERERCYFNGQLATIIEQKGKGKRAKYVIRDGTGYRHENVPASQVEKIDPKEDHASFSYGTD